MQTKKYLIGMMSGTSLDSVDAIICDSQTFEIYNHVAIDLPNLLRQQLFALNKPIANEIHLAKQAEAELTRCYAKAYQQLISLNNATTDITKANIIDMANNIIGIGAHGQTIRHCPDSSELVTPYTIQLLNGAMLSYLTAQTVVCDFRSKDIAAGGQGAPLTPLFHKVFFNLHAQQQIVVVNIGGIANVSLIAPETKLLIGFDTGPGNCLLDEWIYLHQGLAFDNNGKWASSGKIQLNLLQEMLSDDYFLRPTPKSTGRDYFNLQWLQRHNINNYAPVDVMRTLCALSAKTIAQHVPTTCKTVVIAGGGAKNKCLLNDLRTYLPNQTIKTSDEFGIDSQHLEALGFAYLAGATLKHQQQDTTAITGANKPITLGCIYYHA